MSAAGETVGIYLSVPFCRAKCSFCNFASGVSSEGEIRTYLARMLDEIRRIREDAMELGADLPETVDSVYLGGGTPSLLLPEQLAELFLALRAEFTVAVDAEITLEAAPGQIAPELLEAALLAGANRFSLGVQSFVDAEAQAVGRFHDAALCLKEFERLRRHGVHNLGIDLIAGLPYQTEQSWEHSLELAMAAPLEHLSVYMLEVDEDSRLGREVLGGGARLHAPAVASEEEIASRYEVACSRLPGSGLQQYEISNFARSGFRSRHNAKYWARAPYVGFGLDAHSMLPSPDGAGVIRWANADDLSRYNELIDEREVQRVQDREAFEETVFLGLRRIAGLPWSALNGFPARWTDDLHEKVDSLCREDLLFADQTSFSLTSRGRLLSGEIFGELLATARP